MTNVLFSKITSISDLYPNFIKTPSRTPLINSFVKSINKILFFSPFVESIHVKNKYSSTLKEIVFGFDFEIELLSYLKTAFQKSFAKKSNTPSRDPKTS